MYLIWIFSTINFYLFLLIFLFRNIVNITKILRRENHGATNNKRSHLSDDDRLEIGGVETRLKKLGVMIQIDKVHPHKFRRTMATTAIDKGMPIEQVQKLLGHEKIDTTLNYAMVKQSNVKNAHRKYIG